MLLDTYVACAMTAIAPEDYASVRQVVLEVCARLRASGRIPYSEPYEDADAMFEQPSVALQKNMTVLDGCTLFVLVYTHAAATSALIELGYALKIGMPIRVYAQVGVELPYYLRESFEGDGQHVSVTTFESYDELYAVVTQEVS